MVRIGVAGYGNIGQQHCHLIQSRAKREPLKNRLTDVSLTAVCASIDPGLPQVQWFAHLSEMLQADCVDAVLIATPTHTHVELTQLCLDAGVHVLVEKPLAPSVAQAQQRDYLASQLSQNPSPLTCIRCLNECLPLRLQPALRLYLRLQAFG